MTTTNVTILMKFLNHEVRDKLMCFTHDKDGQSANAGFCLIDRYSGGGAVYQPYIWATAIEDLNNRYRDDLHSILKGNTHDCYLYEQYGDEPARIFHLEDFGWKQISKNPLD